MQYNKLSTVWSPIYLRDLLYELVVREMKLRYNDSWFGMAWSLLIPLSQLAVFIFIFGVVLKISIPHYASFAFTGLLAWNWFQISLVEASGAITGSRELVQRPGFPMVILPIITLITHMILFLLGLPALVFVMLISGQPVFGETWLALPLIVLLQFWLTLGIAYLAASLNVLYRDTQHLLGMLLQVVFFMTPIFYDISVVPTLYKVLYVLNPLIALIDAYRMILIQQLWPHWMSLAVLAIFAAGCLGLGLQVFTRMSDRFAEEL